jgi:hypothetical protein
LFDIDFVPPAASGVGEFAVLPGLNTGDFSFLNAGFNTGLLVDRDGSTQEAGDPTLNIPDWLTVPNYSFTLTFIQPGSQGSAECFAMPAAGQVCTPFNPAGPPSAYNLQNFTDTTGGISSSAAFLVSGTVVNLLDPSDTGTFVGEFTTTFLGRSFQNVLADVLAGQSVPAPFSATFTVTPTGEIPEPASIGMALSGMALLGAGLFRRRKSPR